MFKSLEAFNQSLQTSGIATPTTTEKQIKTNPDPKKIGSDLNKYEKTSTGNVRKSLSAKSIVESLSKQNLRMIESMEWGSEKKLDEKARCSSKEYNTSSLDKTTRTNFNQGKSSKAPSIPASKKIN